MSRNYWVGLDSAASFHGFRSQHNKRLPSGCGSVLAQQHKSRLCQQETTIQTCRLADETFVLVVVEVRTHVRQDNG
jgi:hypothetical protein